MVITFAQKLANVTKNFTDIEKLIILTKADEFFKWARRSSLWCFMFGIACCAIEMAAMAAPRFDGWERFGMLPRASPRQADLMIVAGTVNTKIAKRVKLLYEQMLDPKWVIAMGECAICGGPFYDVYNVVDGVDKVIPVDVHIPGCPPRPEAVIYGVMQLQKKIERERAMIK